MSRRQTPATRVLSVVGALAGACALAACGSSSPDGSAAAVDCTPSDGPVTLQYWDNGISGLGEVVDQWNAANPDVTVELQTMDDYPTLTNALAAGEAPDIAQIEYSRMTDFRAQGAFQDVAECLDAVAPDAQEQFIDWTWSQATVGGDGVYAVPQDIGPMAMYYNRATFEELGIAVPTTWEEFRTAAEQFRAAGRYIAHFDPTSAGYFNGMLWQAEASYYEYSDDAWQVTIDTPETREVADYWQGLIDDDLVRTDLVNFSTPLTQAYAAKDISTSLSAAWGWTAMRDNVPDQAGEWAVAPMPVWDASAPTGANWGGSAVAFLQGGEHPYEAAEFLMWLNASTEAVARTYELGGLFPASRAGQDLPALQEGVDYYGGQQIFPIFTQAAEQVDTSFTWGPTQVQVDEALSDGMVAAVGGQGTLGDAIGDAQAAAVSSMQEQSLPVATD